MKVSDIVAGFDPAFRHDATAGVVVRRRGRGTDAVYEVCAVWERRPEKNRPLVPSATVREFEALAMKHGATRLVSDIHYQESVKEHLRRLRFVDAPGGNAGKATVYSAARELIHSGRVKWSAGHRRLTQQMREVMSRPLPGGLIAITSPRRKGAHGDIASALCLALWAARLGDAHENRQKRYRAIMHAWTGDDAYEDPSEDDALQWNEFTIRVRG